MLAHRYLRDLGENLEVLSLQIVTAVRSAEVEAAVSHVALSVLPMMANALRTCGLSLHRKRQLTIADKPRNQTPRRILEAFWPRQMLSRRAGKSLERLLR